MKWLSALPVLAVVGACSFARAPADAATDAAVRQQASLHTGLAVAYLEKHQFDVASAEARRALGIVPGDVDALHVLALTDVAGGHMRSARAHFDQALAARPDDATLLANYGAALCGAGDTAAGTVLLQRAAEVSSVAESPMRTQAAACGLTREGRVGEWSSIRTPDRQSGGKEEYIATRAVKPGGGAAARQFEQESRDD